MAPWRLALKETFREHKWHRDGLCSGPWKRGPEIAVGVISPCTRSILDLALKMVLAWGLFSFFLQLALFWGSRFFLSPPIGVELWICCCSLLLFFPWTTLLFCCLLSASQLLFFSPFMSPSSMPSSCFAFFVSSAHLVVMLLFVVNLFILWLVPFIILCSVCISCRVSFTVQIGSPTGHSVDHETVWVNTVSGLPLVQQHLDKDFFNEIWSKHRLPQLFVNNSACPVSVMLIP